MPLPPRATLLLLLAAAVSCATQPRAPPPHAAALVDALRLSVMRHVDAAADVATDAVSLLDSYRAACDEIAVATPRDQEVPAELGAMWSWARAESEARGVDALYAAFRRFQAQHARKDILPAPRRAWTDLAETILYDSLASVPQALKKVHEMVVNPAGSSIFHQALLESSTTMCTVHQSPQQLLYTMYNSIALTELKGYAMMQFSWMLLRIYSRGNFTLEARIMRERYEERTLQKIEAVKSAMATAKRDYYRCDPRSHVEGETYVQLTRLLQGHIQNEVDMNTDNTCRETCGYYSYTRSYGCYHNLYCAKQQKCNGKLVDCKYYDSDMWVCQAEKESNRRYNWIEYENGRTLGQKASCRRGTTKVDSWWRWLFWHCSYCFCLCDEQGPKSDRYFNLRPAAANVSENMVVTGLRLVKQNRVIHLQIQEGQLLPRGGINETTLRWRPVDDYRVSDSDVVAGRDFHTLSWEQRAIDLDDLVAPKGHVLTGIRFRRVGAHLNLEIMATPLNFTSGTLVQPNGKSHWLGNDKTDASLVGPRTQLSLPSPDVPTRTRLPSLPDSVHEQYVLFGPSSPEADASQTTVPFLDSQPVVTEPPSVLAGAGLFHKGRAGYGGFVAPKLITYDFSEHIHAYYPPAPPEAENEDYDPTPFPDIVN